jgi:hypothetical protein
MVEPMQIICLPEVALADFFKTDEIRSNIVGGS